DDIHKIIDIELGHLYKRISELGYEVKLTDDAKDFLVEKGYDEKFGARPLGRVIQENIKKPLAEELLFGKLEHGGAVKVIVEGKGADAKLGFEYFPAEPKSGKSKAVDDEDFDDDDDGGDGEAALIETAPPRKALPGPRGSRSSRGTKSSGTVPTVRPKPRNKEE
ncbi:MAG: ATP-dependent Clp protease ATP-binding subunit ClpA, partial [Hyphomicrobiaceae bacterium]|nr:ATP-dependent Clp protease ATP-binding subunit ClpA [Hyphomicrobiaceae bacterium]